LEFEIKDKRTEIDELKQEIKDLEYQLADMRVHSKLNEQQAQTDREAMLEAKEKLDRVNLQLVMRNDELSNTRHEANELLRKVELYERE
jgi:chromosome segregation ATPase